MVQFRRLDPLANASPYQKLLKSPVKSFTLTEAQYDRIQHRRPQLMITEGEAAVIGRPYRDYLEIHYAFPEVEAFRDLFGGMFNRVVSASSKQEAPRGVVLSFRDRPNRSLANTVFWSLALEEGEQWVEMNLVAVPEQPEPENSLGEGFSIRPAAAEDRESIRALESAFSGQPPLSDAGLESVFEESRWLQVVTDPSGRAVGFTALRSEPGGWGIVEHAILEQSVAAALREPLLRWTIAFLRNHGGRRQRWRVYMGQADDLALLRKLGFTPGETGVDYTRPVDQAEVRSKIDERQAHGTLIKFGDWR